MTVILEQGTVQGLQYKTKLSNKPYVSYLGIPYARPPIKDLRFKVSNFTCNYRYLHNIMVLK